MYHPAFLWHLNIMWTGFTVKVLKEEVDSKHWHILRGLSQMKRRDILSWTTVSFKATVGEAKGRRPPQLCLFQVLLLTQLAEKWANSDTFPPNRLSDITYLRESSSFHLLNKCKWEKKKMLSKISCWLPFISPGYFMCRNHAWFTYPSGLTHCQSEPHLCVLSRAGWVNDSNIRVNR